MDELILKCLSGNATDLEARRVERWRQESPANERRYQEERRLWEVSGEPRLLGATAPPAAEAVIAEAEARRRRAGNRAQGRALLRSPWLGYGTAAAAVVALVFISTGDRAAPEVGLLSPVGSSSTTGSAVTMDLSDGSVVRLAPSTQVDFPPTRDRREVALSGRAFFAVAHGDVPFVVRTATGSVTVHGTRFEVLAAVGETRLVVVEGQVRLEGTGGAGDVDVSAGQVAYLTPGEAPRVVEPEDVWALLDWGDGLMVYQATPLAQVAAELGRHFGYDVNVAPELAARRVTAWFQDETLEEVVSAVCLVVGAECEVGSSVVTMTGR